MPSRRLDFLLPAPTPALVLALTLCAMSGSEAAGPKGTPEPLSRDRLEEAEQALPRRPELNASEVGYELRLRRPDDASLSRSSAGPQTWTVFLAWFQEVLRWGVWVLIVLGLGLWLARMRFRRARALEVPSDALPPAPTHVREFDIRPRSLPADIGAAALALWQQGDAPAALSLLYRGALSRLVHRHAVPIRASSTEGDCLVLAASRLDGPAHDYLRRLVAAWRQTVYAGRPPDDDDLRALCAAFGQRFPGDAA